MFRRCISLLVLAGFITNQLTVVLYAPHDHAAMTPEEQREHDATPHFHWRSNGERYHHHHAYCHDVKPTAEAPKVAAWEQGHCPPAHDFDAVYGARWSFVLAAGNDNRLSPTGDGTGPATLVLLLHDDPSPSVAFFLWHPPDIVLDGSHRYLTFRHLLI